MSYVLIGWLSLGLLSGMLALTEDGNHCSPRGVLRLLWNVLGGPVTLGLRVYVHWVVRQFARAMVEDANVRQKAALRQALEDDDTNRSQ